MNADLIDHDYNWKQAATQEGVDYAAVQKAFMDQSYGVVANKAKVLFQDPYRLGFEIVDRNEKATKMVGIHAFRVSKKLYYVPTFFVNGELKPADMLYRADVKRFVPLTEEWCAFLVRGVQETSGDVVDRNRRRQADAHMDRLAYPQRVKYASDESFEDAEMEADRAAFVKAAQDGSLWREMLMHSADATPLRKLLPLVIDEHGPEALQKLAAMVESSDAAAHYLATHYDKSELESANGWLAKRASEAEVPAILINLDPSLAKSAATRDRIFDKGYELVDNRPPEAINIVIEEISDGTVKSLAAPGNMSALMDSGELEDVLLLRHASMFSGDYDDCPGELCGNSDSGASPIKYVYFPKEKRLIKLPYGGEVFGDEKIDSENLGKTLKATELKVGKCYIGIEPSALGASEHFLVRDIRKDGDSTLIDTSSPWGMESCLTYAHGRSENGSSYISDGAQFLEVDCDVKRYPDGRVDNVKLAKPEKALMSATGIDKWMRTAGGVVTSNDIRIKPNSDSTFDITHSQEGNVLKSARHLGMLEAHLSLAEDFCLSVDKAGEILDNAVDREVSYRVYDTVEKRAYLTRPEGMQDWVQSFDPELQVRLDAPQRQVLSTMTPQRTNQQSRYGDTYQRVPAQNSDTGAELLPMDAILSKSPEELAHLSEVYDLPHIFDHGCVGQLASAKISISEQVKQYIPDLEAGVDRYFRILFLLRYKPSEFEEMYGRDALIEFEQELAEVAASTGENLLKLLQRFEPDQYAASKN